ncbi:hypothetical protein GCM10027162_76420 [Streptomyces incanus]
MTGLLSTKAWSRPGMVPGSTKTLDRKVSGKITVMLTPITDFSVRSINPDIVQIHENANAKTRGTPRPGCPRTGSVPDLSLPRPGQG